VARQSLETALAQYRQTSQMALTDPKYKIELASPIGGGADEVMLGILSKMMGIAKRPQK
jgi:hypothetical protein